jgi:hypothetical protein
MIEIHVDLLMNEEIAKAIKSLNSRHINSVYATDREEAQAKILELIPPQSVVGIGDSTTMRQLGVIDALQKRGTTVLLDGFSREPKKPQTDRINPPVDSTLADVFLAGTNALTLDGRLVNVDGLGNRVAGMFYGHQLSIVAVGKNKLVETLDEAFHRVRKIIAPNHIRIRSEELGGRKRYNPCVATGVCTDCRSKDRSCNIFTIIEGKPNGTNLNVVIVDEDLGLSWDESWPPERISSIREDYKKYVWVSPRRT